MEAVPVDVFTNVVTEEQEENTEDHQLQLTNQESETFALPTQITSTEDVNKFLTVTHSITHAQPERSTRKQEKVRSFLETWATKSIVVLRFLPIQYYIANTNHKMGFIY